MKNESPQTTYLKNYQPLAYQINNIDLTFDLDDHHTRVTSRVNYSQIKDEDLILNGEELKLLRVLLNDKELSKEEYDQDEKSLILKNLPQTFTLEIETEISPITNTALDGLYKSGNIFCTQNEPHGFRRITYFLDRPDAMGIYTTKIIADKTKYPLLLSNGNLIDKGDLPDHKHWVKWEDPFKKPCYLFALVAGDLGMIEDTFITQSNRKIDLKIYCDKGNESKCWHAMESLKKSMKWDEDTFGLEYDLDIFMIVAVDAFNFGAMENKGLNIFNTSCVLADQASATDDNFYRVEGVVAHEYFHNWTGNRVTCRDWFQLTLKEGLTVFRDQEFSADMNSRPVKRIEDVSHLRAYQFPEDAGPTSHPIKPKSYIEINNFYTMTIYEKGAEVIRMLHTLLGDATFKKGIDKYFELYDGQAVTTEDFIKALTLASDKDLSDFSKWYHQSGTPELEISSSYDEKTKEVILKVKQWTKPTQDQTEKEPLYFPLKLGLLGRNGKELFFTFEKEGKEEKECILIISKEMQEFVFKNVSEKPIFSLNRDFSSPIIIHANYSEDELQFLMKHDPNGFNRWDAAQELAFSLLLNPSFEDGTLNISETFIDNFKYLLEEEKIDHAFKAQLLTLPDENALAEKQVIIDFEQNHLVIQSYLKAIGEKHYPLFNSIYESLHEKGDFKIDPASIGKRKLKNCCLKYLVYSGRKEAIDLAYNQFLTASNMTDKFAAMQALCNTHTKQRELALEAFYNEWKDDPLVMCKWFSVQTSAKNHDTLAITKSLLKHSSFNIKLPNLVRALLGGFISNSYQFHQPSGKGYAFLTEQLLLLDTINPNVSSRIASAFQKYGKLDENRKELMHNEIKKILSTDKLSPNLFEIISKCKTSCS